MKKEKKEVSIDPDKWYWLNEAVVAGLFKSSGIKSYVTIRAFANSKALKVAKWGKGTATRYHVKGKNIIEFLAKKEDGNI